MIGDTKLCVKHYPGACDDSIKKEFIDLFDDEFEDEFTDEFDEEEDLVG